MRIPKVISKNGREYIFVKQCNSNLFLYKEMICGYEECFTKFDLGLVKEVVPATKTYVNPERVKL